MKKRMKKVVAFMAAVTMLTSMAPASTTQAAKKAKLSKTKITLYVGDSTKLKVKGSKKKARFTSTNKKVVKVTKSGTITARKKGSAKVIAKVSDKKLVCKVTVANKTNSGLYLAGGRGFRSWDSLISDNILTVDNNKVLRFDQNKIKGSYSLILDSSVTEIFVNAFSDCTRMTAIKLPNSITSIDSATFSGCTRLTSVSIPDTVYYLGDNAFIGCSNLKKVKLSKNLPCINETTFKDCTRLTSIKIAGNIASIKNGAFSDCTNLKKVSISSSLASIEVNAFANCKKLTSINLPNSLTSIGNYAFSNCTKLTLKVPSTTSSIDSAAFYQVKHVYYNGTAYGNPWGARAYN